MALRSLALLITLMLSACVPGDPPIDPLAADDACDALGQQSLVGQPEAILGARGFFGPVRVLRPGMAVTMDYQPDRLNVALDENGTIIRVTCG